MNEVILIDEKDLQQESATTELIIDLPKPGYAPTHWKLPDKKPNQKRLLLSCNLCPGDLMTLTAAVYSLHKQYPGEYLTEVQTTSGKDIFLNNPHCVALDGTPDKKLDMEYPLINQSNSKAYPFIHGYTHNLGEQLGIRLDLQTNRPHIYVSSEEIAEGNPIAKYVGHEIKFALINAGMKNDFTTKLWPTEYYQEVVDAMAGEITFLQIGSIEPNHYHPRLKNVVDLRGQTSQRELLLLGKWAEFGFGSVTFLQHIMAAWQKPYFCLLGGREGQTWTSYPLQHTFSMIGTLPCCKAGGCWKSRVLPLGDGHASDKSLCENPVFSFNNPVAKCMSLIKPLDVVNRMRLVQKCS